MQSPKEKGKKDKQLSINFIDGVLPMHGKLSDKFRDVLRGKKFAP
jgi:hypothetical protein